VTPEIEALARRAVACKGWRWTPGMLVAFSDGAPSLRIVGPRMLAASVEERGMIDARAPMFPDLSDAPTRGAVLELVREAHGNPNLVPFVWQCPKALGGDAEGRPYGWGIVDPLTTRPLFGTWVGSEAEAMVCALEAAP